MFTALKAFLQKPTTIIGFVVAMMFQLIFSLVWMTGYDGVTDRVNQLKIVVVNEDSGIGKQVAANLQANLPFHVSDTSPLDEAQRQLDARSVQMVLRIPADFSKQLQTPGQKGELQYWINESNPALIKSIMQSAAAQVTATVNKEALGTTAQAVFTQMNVPAAQAQGLAQGMNEKVMSTLHYTNPVSGMANQMVPMMLVLASYVGSMLMAMNMQASADGIASLSKWRKFGVRIVLNVIAAIVIGLVGSSMVVALGGQAAKGFLALWSFQSLFLLCFMSFAQIFLLLFGNAGMLFNILVLSAQLVSSGAMVPRELLSGFYVELSRYLPATHAVEGGMNILFGGPSASGPAWALAALTGASLLAGCLAVAVRRERNTRSGTTLNETAAGSLASQA